MFKVGMGYDIHRLVKNRPLMLGGVQVPHPKGLEGHSDADVVLHAICDAILGALGLGDIGEHFPNTDKTYRGIASLKLLASVYQLAVKAKYKIINVDVSILAQAPKLKAYKDQMKNNIARVLAVNAKDINIKATTTEGLGAIGRQEGIAAYAVVSIRSRRSKRI